MRTPRHARRLTLLTATLLASPAAATATVVTWTGAAGLDWHANDNWSGGAAAGSVVGHTAVFTASSLGTVSLAASPLNPLRGITIGSGSGGTA